MSLHVAAINGSYQQCAINHGVVASSNISVAAKYRKYDGDMAYHQRRKLAAAKKAAAAS